MAEINSSPYKGSAQITREQFLFYEMRTTARLMSQGMNDGEIIDRIVEENLFQYPTEKSVCQMAKACIARLKVMGDEDLVEAVASHSSETAKQILWIVESSIWDEWLSSAPVGSSARSSLGLLMMALAQAHRCFWPPDT